MDSALVGCGLFGRGRQWCGSQHMALLIELSPALEINNLDASCSGTASLYNGVLGTTDRLWFVCASFKSPD